MKNIMPKRQEQRQEKSSPRQEEINGIIKEAPNRPSKKQNQAQGYGPFKTKSSPK